MRKGESMNVTILTLENGFVVLGEGRRFYTRSFEQVCETVKAIRISCENLV